MDKDHLTELQQWHSIQQQGMGEFFKQDRELKKFLRWANDEFSVGTWVKFWRTG